MNQIKTVDCTTLQQWLDHGEAIIIDVREDEEYRTAHIQDAILMPLSTFSPMAIPESNGKKIVLQCKVGGRSARACAMCQETDSRPDFYNLEGGIDAWVAAGYPVEISPL